MIERSAVPPHASGSSHVGSVSGDSLIDVDQVPFKRCAKLYRAGHVGLLTWVVHSSSAGSDKSSCSCHPCKK
eukprot:5441842-Prymnesium_polylepis.1